MSLTGIAMAQRVDAEIHGKVVDESGAPVAGATVGLGNQTTVTDADGAFVVTGGGKLTVSASGYEAQAAGAVDGVVVRLAPASGEVITVSGRAPEESKPLEYTMSAQDVRTTPGAMNDALRAVTVLPAAARIPFSFGGLVLRGMSPRDSSVFIDGVEIPLAFHFGGITGVFPTQVLGDMKVVPSGFDVSIGRTQGARSSWRAASRGDRYWVGGEASLCTRSPAPRVRSRTRGVSDRAAAVLRIAIRKHAGRQLVMVRFRPTSSFRPVRGPRRSR